MSRLINGKMLETNLLRGGVDLAVETDILYVDVNNNRIGINKVPAQALDVTGNAAISGDVNAATATIAGLVFNTNEITAPTTVLKLTSTDGIEIAGDLDFTGTDSLLTPPTYTTALLPGTPTEGGMVYDSTTKQVKFYDGTQWSDAGSAQGLSVYVLNAATTDATQTEALVGGSGGTQLVLSDNTTWRFEANIVARRTDAADESAGYKFTGVIDRQVGVATTAIVGVVAEVIDAEDDATWLITVDADAATGALRVQVTGAAAKDISWVVFVRTVEVSN